MTGSIPFSIEESDNFKRSFKKLAKVHKSSFVELIARTLEDLIDDQYPNNSRNEPLPGKIQWLSLVLCEYCIIVVLFQGEGLWITTLIYCLTYLMQLLKTVQRLKGTVSSLCAC